MLAEEFGYQVSSRPAEEMTPSIRSAMDEALTATTKKRIGMACLGGYCFFIIFGTSLFLAALAKPTLKWAVACGGLLLGCAAYSWITDSSKTNARELREAVTAATSSPWQVWPCRLEAVQGEEARRLLLAPDGSVASEFRSTVPGEVWTGMTDGRGLVWLAGDMRFGGIVSLPGGSPVWWARLPKTEPETNPSSDIQRRIEEELTRRAIGFVFDQWL
ncbi:hypothetical protein ACWET9_19095 [Streptomyces sp. NPDC004059]